MLELSADLRFGYATATAWQMYEKISLEAGQLVALVGRNGAGKSTFLRTLARQEPLLGGEIWLKGQKTSAYSLPQYARMAAVVRTERVQVPYCTLRELVQMGRLPYMDFWGRANPADKQATAAALTALGIAHLAERQLGDCSDGEQQLALLARALAQDTPLLLLDEITSHLDFLNRELVFERLRTDCEQRGRLTLLATHELNLVWQYATHLLVFQGRQARLYRSSELSMEALLALWRE